MQEVAMKKSQRTAHKSQFIYFESDKSDNQSKHTPRPRQKDDNYQLVLQSKQTQNPLMSMSI